MIRQPTCRLGQALGPEAVSRPGALLQVLREVHWQPVRLFPPQAAPGMAAAAVAPAAGMHHPRHVLLEPSQLVLNRALMAEVAIHSATQGDALRQAETDRLLHRQLQGCQPAPQLRSLQALLSQHNPHVGAVDRRIRPIAPLQREAIQQQ